MPVSKHTPSLFADDSIDRAALVELGGRSMSRKQMQASGMVPVAKSTDLFEFGYTVIHWIVPGLWESEVLEFVPRSLPGKPCDLPRITLESFEDQAALHRAIGARVTGPGVPFQPVA